MGGHHFEYPYSLLHTYTLIYPITSPLSLTRFIMAFSFIQPCILFLTWVGGLLLCAFHLLFGYASIMSIMTFFVCSFSHHCLFLFFSILHLIPSIFESSSYHLYLFHFYLLLYNDDVLSSQSYQSGLSHPSFRL